MPPIIYPGYKSSTQIFIFTSQLQSSKRCSSGFKEINFQPNYNITIHLKLKPHKLYRHLLRLKNSMVLLSEHNNKLGHEISLQRQKKSYNQLYSRFSQMLTYFRAKLTYNWRYLTASIRQFQANHVGFVVNRKSLRRRRLIQSLIIQNRLHIYPTFFVKRDQF